MKELKIVKNIKCLQEIVFTVKKKKQSIGFVPTMGSLHAGHLSLIEAAASENDFTICSIYINPTQFNDKNDFNTYPRSYETDIELLKSLDCDLVFLPNDTEMYPRNKSIVNYNFTFCMNILEGEKRPGHFSGVINIVNTLFNLTCPSRAYFGEKDYQQLWIIKSFVKNFHLPIKIRSCPTVRDSTGLALSSRNANLNKEEKIQATHLFKTLQKFKLSLESEIISTKDNIIDLKKNFIDFFTKNSLIKLDYIEIIDEENFSFVNRIKKNIKYRILIAAHVGRTRLIDNIPIG